jgi:hypothetical protein
MKAYRDAEEKQGKSQTTANLTLKTLRSMFSQMAVLRQFAFRR